MTEPKFLSVENVLLIHEEQLLVSADSTGFAMKVFSNRLS